jgi:hypothetical protein
MALSSVLGSGSTQPERPPARTDPTAALKNLTHPRAGDSRIVSPHQGRTRVRNAAKSGDRRHGRNRVGPRNPA